MVFRGVHRVCDECGRISAGIGVRKFSSWVFFCRDDPKHSSSRVVSGSHSNVDQLERLLNVNERSNFATLPDDW